MSKTVLTGSQAVVEALKQINPAVFASYPITPQTPIIEGFADLVANGLVTTEFIPVESEHSAMSAVIGAQATGVRATTATSSQGLILMHEMLHIASGLRLPTLMNVAARALSAPINIHGDHSDVMNVRDSGWIQLFCENPQEVYDFNFIALKMAEETNTPAMVIQDGFLTSHSVEVLETLPDEKIIKFVGEYKPKHYLLDFEDPKTFGPLVLQNHYIDIKKEQVEDFDKSMTAFSRFVKEYKEISGREYFAVETYGDEKSDIVIVCLGSTAGTVKHYIKTERPDMRLVKVSLFRPFDYKLVESLLEGAATIIVLEKSAYYGTSGPLTAEVNASLRLLSDVGSKIKVKTFVYGLGGADFGLQDLEEIVKNI